MGDNSPFALRAAFWVLLVISIMLGYNIATGLAVLLLYINAELTSTSMIMISAKIDSLSDRYAMLYSKLKRK